MMVGTDEASYAWFDEGLATFLEDIALADLYDIADPFAADRASYLSVAGSDIEVPMMRHTDLVTPYGARTTAAYSKPAVLLRALEWVVGAETFRETLNDFTRDWLWGHPTPWDFFSAFELASGQGLGWFFTPWWFSTGVLDHAVVSVEGAETGSAVVTIENRGTIAVPAALSATTVGGGSVSVIVAADAWLDGSPTLTITVEAVEPIESVVLDPQHIFPDIDRANNVWQAGAAGGGAVQ
jgi:aminopeptidase N